MVPGLLYGDGDALIMLSILHGVRTDTSVRAAYMAPVPVKTDVKNVPARPVTVEGVVIRDCAISTVSGVETLYCVRSAPRAVLKSIV